ncbi:DNA polymerase I [Phycisphaera mikurensis]|uniref:DNA polymerase I n=1 Tax=Phycisphaera mikurensis (strain NBRC 102666 / KCTC 22515 / FYK2301M01) TaxID=1142394 RepID=I0IC96_PHYMF|nr:DNA polymerase I [Phycisphaera mikurensis]MBB6441897.1 DNA polymerase-1 [Phycisphaera mikurensis]BAM02884.1 DNA polymerase I [Phycisphaera mikurensis NBRC 102666]
MPDAKPETVYLIDGHYQFFRAYHAIRGGMTSPVTGEPTGAVFAFTAMLLKFFDTCRPTRAALVIDSDEPTFRHALDPAYKGNRIAPPEDFKPQIPVMIEIARGFGLPVLAVPGAEADDIMATLADRLTAADPALRVTLVSKDKDLEQVISDRVVLYDVQTQEVRDEPGLLEKKGITPAQAIDYQALIGDTSDNVPGVEGIGPKTASKLLEKFGDLDGVIAGVPTLKGKQRERLEAAIASGQLALSKQLVTLMRDVETGFDADDAAVSIDAIDDAALLALFERCGFNGHPRELARLKRTADNPEASLGRAKQPDPREEAPAGGLFATPAAEDEPQDDDARYPAFANAGYTCLTSRTAVEQAVEDARSAGRVAVDTETLGMGHHTGLAGVSMSWKEGEAVYIPVLSPEPDTHLGEAEVIELLRPLLEDASVAKLGQNFKYDLHVLAHGGVEVQGPVFDSMVAAFLCNAPGLGMDALALAELDHRCIPIAAVIGEKPRKKADPPQKSIAACDLARVTAYAAEDADVTLRLCNLLEKRCAENGVLELARNVEMPLVPILFEMERAGILVDPDRLEEQRARLAERADELKAEMEAAVEGASPTPEGEEPPSLDSPKQLGALLFDRLGFPVQKKTKTGYSTDAEVLEKLSGLAADGALPNVPTAAHGLPAGMLEYRMLSKLTGTYFAQLQAAAQQLGDSRVHCSFNPTGAATGRLSSSDPNLQNIPIRTETGKQIRSAFVAPEGMKLIAADYSQVELRVLAHLSEDEALLEAFAENRDVHTAVAAEVFKVAEAGVTKEQRNAAKTINFGIVYGVTAFGLARRIEGLDNAGAAELIDAYKARYAGIDRFLQQCVTQARDSGFVTTILGRRRVIDGIDSRNPNQRSLAERLAINSVVQGSAADLIKTAMVDLDRRIRSEDLPLRVLLQVHDELVAEAPAGRADELAGVMREVMSSAMTLRCPLEVEASVGADWLEAK